MLEIIFHVCTIFSLYVHKYHHQRSANVCNHNTKICHVHIFTLLLNAAYSYVPITSGSLMIPMIRAPTAHWRDVFVSYASLTPPLDFHSLVMIAIFAFCEYGDNLVITKRLSPFSRNVTLAKISFVKLSPICPCNFSRMLNCGDKKICIKSGVIKQIIIVRKHLNHQCYCEFCFCHTWPHFVYEAKTISHSNNVTWTWHGLKSPTTR